MTVKEFKELFKGEMKFFDYATGKAIGEEFKTEKNESLQELKIANIELGIKANSVSVRPKYSDVDIIKPEYSAYVKVFVDINTKTLKMLQCLYIILGMLEILKIIFYTQMMNIIKVKETQDI